MKKCPKNCGMYQDYESKCLVCGARLLKVKDSGQQTSQMSNPVQQTGPVSNSGANSNFGGSRHPQTAINTPSQNRGYIFNDVKSQNVTSQFSYDRHVYGMAQQPIGNTTNQISRNNVQQNVQTNINSNLTRNRFRGKVKNLREDSSPMGKGESFFYSLAHGTHMTKSDKAFNFQLIEMDQDDNPTGMIYSITFRGEIMVGHFYDGNVVIVEGKRARTGEVYAKNIYNETSNCVVKVKSNLF